LPLIVPLLQEACQGHWFAKLDLVNCFWNMRARDEDTKQLMGFEVPRMGFFVFCGLAQGPKQGPSAFQRYMKRVLEGLEVRNYIDDVIIWIVKGGGGG
jgi:hypothetical protein